MKAHRFFNGSRWARARDESGIALVITALAMTALIAMLALVISAAIAEVHARHLQTQADAAAYAGAQVMKNSFENGSCSNTDIANAVAQYNGAPQSSSTPYNPQVPASPQYSASYSSTAHNLFGQLNQSNYDNQTFPGDTGLTGKPCSDSTVDVKLTETNLPTLLSPFSSHYINKQAQIRAEGVSEASAAPFLLPNILTPNDTAGFIVAENASSPSLSTDTILDTLESCADNGDVSPCLTDSNNGGTWTATGVSVGFTTGPTALIVAQSGTPFTTTQLAAVTSGATLSTFCNTTPTVCYDSTNGVGLTYTRTYTASTPTFPTQAPVISDTSVADSTLTSICESTGSTGLFTGFMVSSGSCSVNVFADINFGSTESCSQLTSLGATLSITPTGGTAVPLTCPATGGSQTAAGSATGQWETSSAIPISSNSGPIKFDLTWSRTGGGSTTKIQSWETGGVTTGGNTGQCSSASGKACTNDFGIIQRVYSGAYDQNTAANSPSGDVAGAALTTATGEVMSTPANTTVSGLGVTIDFQALSDTAAASDGNVPNASFQDIAFGVNQGNGLANCGQGTNDANTTQEQAIAGEFVCTNYPILPAGQSCGSCPGTVPGNKWPQWLNGGMAARIYGTGTCPIVSKKGTNGCPTPMTLAECEADPNYWDTSNLMSSVLNNSSDPRLITVMVTDPGQIPNGANPSNIPIRHYAEFYVTGWSNDPCSGMSYSGTNATNNLAFTSDDVAPTDSAGDFFLVGHFVKYFQPGATGSGTTCQLSSIDNCTLTQTK